MTPLYQQVCQTIMEKLAAGSLKVGDKLPPESDYAAQLGVSRSTLRLAFGELERQGVLHRRKRFGTQIISDQPSPRFDMGTTGVHELLSLGRDTILSLTGIRTVATEEIAHLDGYASETGHWLEVSGTRSLSGAATPFNVNQVYVPARFAGIEPLLKTQETSVYRAIEQNFGVAVGRVSQKVTAVPCPRHEARILGLDEGAPVLQILAQLYVDDGTLMEVSLALFDPARFQVHTDVRIS